MPPQLETLKGNHEKASEELHDRREHMGELQQLYDAAVDELTEARKGVIRMEQEVAKARHARDVQREETKVNLTPSRPLCVAAAWVDCECKRAHSSSDRSTAADTSCRRKLSWISGHAEIGT